LLKELKDRLTEIETLTGKAIEANNNETQGMLYFCLNRGRLKREKSIFEEQFKKRK